MKRHHRIKGSSTPVVLMFIGGFAMIGYSVLDMNNVNERTSLKASQKVQATNLAESGVQQLFDSIRRQMQANNTYPMSINTTNYSAPTSAGTIVLGQYNARLLNVDTQMRDVNGRRQTTYIYDVEGLGVVNGISSTIRAQFSGTVVHYLEEIRQNVGGVRNADQIYFPAAAIAAAETVEIETDQGLRTYSPDGKSGHILANKGISWNPKGGASKNGFVNPNILDVQGMILVHRDQKGRTEGPTGIGNSNGKKNYRTPIISSGGGLPAIGADSVYGMDAEVGFASETVVNNWKNNWISTTAKTGSTRYTRSIKSDEVPQRPGDQWRVIPTPAYIDGDLEVLPGQQLRLMPSSSNNVENIVYVKGKVKNMGALLNLGVTLVIEDGYEDGPTSEYKLDTQGTPYNTRKKVLQASSLVCLKKSSEAIKIKTNSSALTGVMYAANGGISVESSNAELSGMLVAGGRGGNGGVRIKPGGGSSFVVRYEPDAAGAGDFDPKLYQNINLSYRTTTVAQGFQPSNISKWVQVK